MTNGVIAQKLQLLEEVLVELRSLEDVPAKRLAEDWRTGKAIGRCVEVGALSSKEPYSRSPSAHGVSPPNPWFGSGTLGCTRMRRSMSRSWPTS